MRIAFINIYQNTINRGAETFIEEVSCRLGKNNYVQIFGGEHVNFDWTKKDMTGGWQRIFFLDYWSLKIASFTLKIIPDLLSGHFDIIIPLNGGWQSIIIRIVTWISSSKLILSGQSGMGWDDRINLYSFPNAFISLSSKSLDWARKINPFVKSFYIPNGVDLNKFTFKGPSFELQIKKPIILAVGAFTEQKRLDLAIKAVSQLKNVSLLIVGGGGDLKEKLQIEGKNILENRFQIVSVPFQKMPDVYRAADIFTLPSNSSESFGNVLVEAMATNIPVVATSDPIRTEIVGTAGILVDPINIDEYAQTLQEALDINWGNKPRKQAEKFSWDKIAEQYEELFKSLVKEE